MVTVSQIASAVYGCIVGNWLLNLYQTFTYHPGGEHQFVVLAQIQTGEYIKVLETDSQTVAFDFEGEIAETTNTIVGYTLDRSFPGDKEELNELEILNTVPIDAEERDKLMAIMREARKYW